MHGKVCRVDWVSSGVEQDTDLSAGRCLQVTDVGYLPDKLSCSTSNLLPYHTYISSLSGSFFSLYWTVFEVRW